jgi:hypothetical protein
MDDDHSLAAEMVECDIRNKLAWTELYEFNHFNRFVYKHPIVAEHKQYHTLLLKFRTDLRGFMTTYLNAQKNAKRYETYIRSRKKQYANKESYKKLYLKAINKTNLMQKILEENTKA